MRLIPLSELTETDMRAWERLGDRAAVPNPFFEPGFAAVAARTLREVESWLLVAEGTDGRWIGCLPVRKLPRRGPRLALGTWNHDYSFLGTPLVDRDRLGEYAKALVETISKRATGRFFVLRDVDEGPVLDALREAIAAAGNATIAFERSVERAAAERRPEPEYTAGLRSSRRKGLARRRRKLEKQLDGDLEFRDLSCVDGAVETFLALEASGWKGKEGTAMACDPASAEFFSQMCEWFHQRGRLRMRAMQGDDGAIVINCNVAAGDHLFSFKTAFDESFRQYAPGLLLQLDDFAAWHEREQEDLMDSCGDPDAQSLNELWPDRRKITTLLVGRPGPLAFAAGMALRFHFSPTGRRIVGILRHRNTRAGVAAGFITRHQYEALEISQTAVPA